MKRRAGPAPHSPASDDEASDDEVGLAGGGVPSNPIKLPQAHQPAPTPAPRRPTSIRACANAHPAKRARRRSGGRAPKVGVCITSRGCAAAAPATQLRSPELQQRSHMLQLQLQQRSGGPDRLAHWQPSMPRGALPVLRRPQDPLQRLWREVAAAREKGQGRILPHKRPSRESQVVIDSKLRLTCAFSGR